MYIQITTRCNMSCGHCCYSCGPKGRDMKMETFRQALEFNKNFDEMVSLGGGEPTIHPHFWEIVGLSLGNAEYVWMSTNGKETETALALSKIAKHGVMSVELSLDPWHEKIDPRVEEAYKKAPRKDYGERDNQDLRGIRTVTNIIKRGRAKWGKVGCCCEEVIITPNGNVYQCGCQKTKIGTVWSPPDELNFESGTCEKENQKKGVEEYAEQEEKRVKELSLDQD